MILKNTIKTFRDIIICNLFYKTRADKILFIHLAKTAGTSLRLMLEKEFGPCYVYPGRFYLRKFSKSSSEDESNYLSEKEIIENFENLPKHNVLVGHFSSSIVEALPLQYKKATFVRNPIQRSLSALAHFSTTRNVPVNQLLEDSNFLEANIINYQTRLLGAGDSFDLDALNPANDSTLERAMSLLKKLDFVGITEKFDESCYVFDRVFETNISKKRFRKNVLRPMGNEYSEIIPWLKPLLKLDLDLYKTTLESFNSRYKLFLSNSHH
jgi:hypothetical protein